MRIDRNFNGSVEDVVIHSPKMVHMEMLDDSTAYIVAYLNDEDAIFFNVKATEDGTLEIRTQE